MHRCAHCDAPLWLRPEPWFPATSRQPCCSQARYVQAGSAQADFPPGRLCPGPPLPWAGPALGGPALGCPALGGSAQGGSAQADFPLGPALPGRLCPDRLRPGLLRPGGLPASRPVRHSARLMASRSKFRKSSYIPIISRRWRCGSLPGRSLADRWRRRPAASAVTRTPAGSLAHRAIRAAFQPRCDRNAHQATARPGRLSGPAGAG